MTLQELASAQGLYRAGWEDLAHGWLTGFDFSGLPSPRIGRGLDPRAAFEQAVRVGLERPPFVLQFSGGRDSSVILAVALHVARREGLPAPVAVTARYPGDEAADEREWQEQVVAHVGLRDWEVITATDSGGLLSEDAKDSLLRHGVLWPPTSHVKSSFLLSARGGTLATGESGDEVCGATRVTPLRALCSRRRPSRGHVAVALQAVSTQRHRQGRELRALESQGQQSWLAPDLRADFMKRVAADRAAEPLDYRRAVWRHLGARAVRIGLHNLTVLARDAGCTMHYPFRDPVFVSALGHAIGPAGHLGRTSLLRRLFADLLPDQVLSRTSKARFHHARINAEARAFARAWSGEGLEHTGVVDAQALREEWLSARPRYSSFCLLQQAWLHDHEGETR